MSASLLPAISSFRLGFSRAPISSICRQCLLKSNLSLRLQSTAATSRSPILRRTNRTFSFTSRSPSVAVKSETPLGGLANSFARSQQVVRQATTAKAKEPYFKDVSDKVVGYWLLGSAGLVFGIVVLGGLTRLTESGLSITEWKPITGVLPPLTLADWQENFAKYKDSPEYRILNPKMTLEEFKFIYYMEWAHRLMGRVIGLSFVLPAIYFVARRKVSAKTAGRMFGIASLIGFQGFIGWWMVQSGLKDDLFAKPGSTPRVSQYRLTAHLGTAFLVYATMLWSGLDILRTHRLLSAPNGARDSVKALSNPTLNVFRRSVGGIVLLIFITAMSGGLVAGLDAGLIYNEFPYMGTGFIPPRKEMFDAFYSHLPDNSDLWWRNLLENPTTVQFDHRCMALTTFTSIISLFLYSRFNKPVAAALPPNVKRAIMGVVHLACLQVTLGIFTLLYLVPTPLAATHQAGSLALLTGGIVLGSRVWVPRAAERIAMARIKGGIKGVERRVYL